MAEIPIRLNIRRPDNFPLYQRIPQPQLNRIDSDDSIVITKTIARGGQGVIYEGYIHGDYDMRVVVKSGISPTDLDKDIAILKDLEKKRTCNNLYVRTKIYTFEDNFRTLQRDLLQAGQTVLISERMNGDLYSLLEYIIHNYNHMDATVLKNLLNVILEGLICFEKANHYYTDLKLENILFKFINDTDIIIAFGDLGSMTTQRKLVVGENLTHTFKTGRMIKMSETGDRRTFDIKESDVVSMFLFMMFDLLELFNIFPNGKDDVLLEVGDSYITMANKLIDFYNEIENSSIEGDATDKMVILNITKYICKKFIDMYNVRIPDVDITLEEIRTLLNNEDRTLQMNFPDNLPQITQARATRESSLQRYERMQKNKKEERKQLRTRRMTIEKNIKTLDSNYNRVITEINRNISIAEQQSADVDSRLQQLYTERAELVGEYELQSGQLRQALEDIERRLNPVPVHPRLEERGVDNDDFEKKYIKYKTKYLALKKQLGE